MCTNISWHLSGAQEACSGAARAGLSGPGQVKAGARQVKGLRPMGRAWCRGRSTPRVGPAVMEGSHMSEGGGRGSEQRPRLPHTLPLVSLPRPAPALPPAPPHLFCSPPAVHSLWELWLWAASSPPSRARVLPPVSAAWLLEPRPPGEEGGRWHRAERSRKGPRPPLRAAGGPVQLVSNASTPGLRATGGRPRT